MQQKNDKNIPVSAGIQTLIEERIQLLKKEERKISSGSLKQNQSLFFSETFIQSTDDAEQSKMILNQTQNP